MALSSLQKAKGISCRARSNILRVVHRAKGGHLGGSLSVVDILSAIYAFNDEFNIEVILSKGHCLLAWICVLHELGEISKDELNNYYCEGSKFAGHPKRGSSKSISWGTGSLGHGLSVTCGKAMVRPEKHYFCILGDGECNEGSVWEGLMFLAQRRLGNVTVIVDNNKQESLDKTCNILDIEDMEKRLSGFKLKVERVDGHDIDRLMQIVGNRLNSQDCADPMVIIADTVKGKGVSFMERVPMWHHRKLSDQELATALSEVVSEEIEL